MQTTMDHPRGRLPPVAPNKRKEIEKDETFDFLKPSTLRPPKLPKPKPVAPQAAAPTKTAKAISSRPAPTPSPNISSRLAGAAPIKTSKVTSSRPAPTPAQAPIKTSKAISSCPAPTPAQAPAPAPAPAPNNSMLLAGYLAHEFLNNGTLFGQPWAPARTEPMRAPTTTHSAEPMQDSTAAHSADSRRSMKQPSSSTTYKGKALEPEPKFNPKPNLKPSEPELSKNKRYAEVSELIKGGNGAHITGIVNPSQLARFLHLK